MHDELQQLIDAYLDDQLSPAKLSRLNELIKGNAENASQFVQATFLHDRLHAELQADVLSLWHNIDTRAGSRQTRFAKAWTVSVVAAIAAALLIAVFLWHGGTTPTASAAVVALGRMIEAAKQPIDRVYRIRVTDPGPAGVEPPVFSGAKGRKPGIDGALLYVRGSDQFVLIRYFGNGTEFITGSDGSIGWAVAPKGHVHLSHDTRRFRRAVPGEHEDIPFVDLQAGFGELQRGYDLELVAADQIDADSKGRSLLLAVKRSANRPGPERVQIQFDSAGVAHQIELSGLPRDEMKARGVVLELVEQRDLGPEYFKHEAHHAADRPIDWE